jgi:hypothetical protein
VENGFVARPGTGAARWHVSLQDRLGVTLLPVRAADTATFGSERPRTWLKVIRRGTRDMGRTGIDVASTGRYVAAARRAIGSACRKTPERGDEMKLVTPRVAICALALIGCGSSTPNPSTTEAKSAISAAEATGATGEPEAALHLKMAEDQVRAAEALIEEGDTSEARLVLERAKVDAQLAQVLTRRAQMRARAQRAQQEIQRLQQSARP